jgi:hypothetical protein
MAAATVATAPIGPFKASAFYCRIQRHVPVPLDLTFLSTRLSRAAQLRPPAGSARGSHTLIGPTPRLAHA